MVRSCGFESGVGFLYSLTRLSKYGIINIITVELLEMKGRESRGSLYNFEKNLLSYDQWTDFLADRLRLNDPGLKKVYVIIHRIRERALSYAHERDSMLEYYVALFFHAVKFLRSKIIPTCKKFHRDYALISAGILSKTIERMLRDEGKLF